MAGVGAAAGVRGAQHRRGGVLDAPALNRPDGQPGRLGYLAVAVVGAGGGEPGPDAVSGLLLGCSTTERRRSGFRICSAVSHSRMVGFQLLAAPPVDAGPVDRHYLVGDVVCRTVIVDGLAAGFPGAVVVDQHISADTELGVQRSQGIGG